ncbi:(2E,6E)-farnesyl diphosphate synthase [Spiribacter vilamensis]|uniref:Farnesyl-diphosphate synthase n=1 Tax=Spiribacter vilamensis TaxID=531306 RepID=A0A4Q8CYK1_9GAMM|nr:farnesyl diphosphate synthase [Spiribacter vilamensis]RZU97967.1 farnesyl-diphosphate synthase [Spiribacter vilamensis]TVO61120.1 (2E,6E)-farnesyl diphosphate synthase [Spiribacter vilamensis]
MASLSDSLTQARARVEAVLDQALPDATLAPERLHEAMRYAALAPGKRLRPFLVYQAGLLFDAIDTDLDSPACAVEMIHAYSLIHDDLPAMDDDDLRRGQPTCHRAFDESTAILAGDALQTLAFQRIAETGPANAERRIRMIATLAEAVGSRGMAGGQALDLGAVRHRIDVTELETMHRHKTGALILASLRLGSLGAVDGPDADQHSALDHYGQCIGLAFQVQDDILDVTGDSRDTGKARGADARREKPTYPGLMGLEASQRFARHLRDEAIQAMETFGPRADTLRSLADYIISRER